MDEQAKEKAKATLDYTKKTIKQGSWKLLYTLVILSLIVFVFIVVLVLELLSR